MLALKEKRGMLNELQNENKFMRISRKPKHSEPLNSFKWCSLCGTKMEGKVDEWQLNGWVYGAKKELDIIQDR